MEDWKERVIAEHNELTEKYNSLCDFIDAVPFDSLAKPDRELLICQKYAMKKYAQILSNRIANF